MRPVDTAGKEEYPEAVVPEVPEAMPAALDCDTEVHALGRTVAGAGAVVVEDLRAPSLEGATESTEFGDGILLAADDRLVEEGGRLLHVLGQIHITHRLLGQPGTEHLRGGVADAEADR
jgi:hypothetical protein